MNDKVPDWGEPQYSWRPGPHYLIDDDGNVVGCFPAIKEPLLSEQKFSKITNIRRYLREI